MSQTPPEVLKSSTAAAEPADQLTISREQDAFRLELRGQSGNGTVGVVKREELQRILHTPFRVWGQLGSKSGSSLVTPPMRLPMTFPAQYDARSTDRPRIQVQPPRRNAARAEGGHAKARLGFAGYRRCTGADIRESSLSEAV
jgi:hypothetical protein